MHLQFVVSQLSTPSHSSLFWWKLSIVMTKIGGPPAVPLRTPKGPQQRMSFIILFIPFLLKLRFELNTLFPLVIWMYNLTTLINNLTVIIESHGQTTHSQSYI